MANGLAAGGLQVPGDLVEKHLPQPVLLQPMPKLVAQSFLYRQNGEIEPGPHEVDPATCAPRPSHERGRPRSNKFNPGPDNSRGDAGNSCPE